jgi:hypothetical protein
MADFVAYIPILTTVLSIPFAALVFRRYLEKRRAGEEQRTHLLWWAIGIFMFGAGTFAEGFTTLFGWHEPMFRNWYIVGALLGGAPLAQGTVYLHVRKSWADRMALVAFGYVAVAAFFVLIVPVDASLADEDVLNGDVMEWQWVRLFSPLINTYAFIFLVGGAVYSAMRYRQRGDRGSRVAGNALIAVGALLPGIGGSFSRGGATEVLYVMEFIGIILIYLGYRLNIGEPLSPWASNARAEERPAGATPAG